MTDGGVNGSGRKISLIRVPFWLGCGKRGTELGPDSVVEAGLIAQIEALGAELASDEEVDCRLSGAVANDASAGLTAADTGSSSGEDCGGKVKHLAAVRGMSKRVAASVYRAAAAGRFPLVLGGDHSIAIGSLAGLTAHSERLGVIWIDAHADMNTEETTPSGNAHGIPLAVALGKAFYRLTELPGARLLQPGNLVIVGARDLDPGERELIRAEGIACFTMHDIDRFGMAAVMAEALDIAGRNADGVHVSFDMDSLDPSEAGGVGTPVRGGLSYREAHLAMELLAESGRVTSMDIVEVNALLDSDKRTARLAVELAASLLGKRIL